MAGFADDANGFDVVYADNVDFSGGATPVAQITLNGQLLIGSTALPHIRVGTLTAGSGVTITNGAGTISIAAGPGVVQTITGDSGSVTGTPILLFAHSGSATLAGASVSFTARSATQMDLDLTDLSDNITIGRAAGNLTKTGGANVGGGPGFLQSYTSGSNNVGWGYRVLNTLTTGSNNVGLGIQALVSLLNGGANVALGASAGSNYTGAESNNILINATGTLGESNVMRLGIQGSGTQQVNQTFIAGVQNQLSGLVVPVTTPGGYPYTTLITDQLILVDTTSARTIVPLAAPVTGTTYRIKDNVGSGAANNITITPSGKNIDGAASKVINTNWGSLDIIYNGTQWNAL
jgi:hypothetical protein